VFLLAGSSSCTSCETGTQAIAGSALCVTLVAFVIPPVAAMMALLFCILCVFKRRAAFAKATAPSGLHYPCPLLKTGTPVQDLLPAFEQLGIPTPNTYAVVDGKLPAGLQINKRTGAITGVPAMSGSALSESTFRIKASNLKGYAECEVILQVETRTAPADLCYMADTFLVVGAQVSLAPVLRLGAPNTGFRALDLPRGLELNPVTGVISGAAKDEMAQCTFTVTASNDYGGTSCQVSLAILDLKPPYGLQYANLSEDTFFVVGESCKYTPAFCNGWPEAVFSMTPDPPQGVTVDAVSGVIAGVPLQPQPREAYTVRMQNVKGQCEFKFSLEVQLQIPPLFLTYTAFDLATSNAQGKLYCILVCGELIQPATPELKQGNYLTFKADPPLPSGLEIHLSAGVITGTPTVPTNKTMYTITASNSKGSIQTQISFATCFHYAQTPPNDWSVEQVQVWADQGLNLEPKDRENLLSLNGQKLLSLRSLEALRSELPKIQAAVHRLLLLDIENLERAQLASAQPNHLDSQVTRAPLGAKRGDPADKSMLPAELRGDYEPICVLGNGGYGAVFQASRVVKGHAQYHVAIKIFHSDRPFPECNVKRMNREASLLGRIDSPHVVKLKGSGMSSNASIYWLIMDFLDGNNLQELLEGRHFFNEDKVCEMAWQLLLGLQAIHKLGVVHCDVKPANVMQCTSSQSTVLYKLVDLGIAVATAAAASLATMRDLPSLRGTPGYICPEIIRNEINCIAPQADIWSLAVTMFEIVTGMLPFCTVVDPNKPSLFDLMAVAVNLDEEPPDVTAAACFPISTEFASIVRRALWKRREGRYASAEEMKAALRAYMDSKHSDQHCIVQPPRWTQADAQSGQPLRVVLDMMQEEFCEVAALFKTSLDPRFPVTILRVERIQNLGQWGLYQAKKRDMELRGDLGHGERRLFHGTDEETVPKIVSTAFNRSYCGKNASAYGQGVYFARDARYSADDTYSRPDAQGNKHVFLCRVLVGAYARGDSGMRVPPARVGSDGVFDATVDDVDQPSIFVVYHDAQVDPLPPASALSLPRSRPSLLQSPLPPSLLPFPSSVPPFPPSLPPLSPPPHFRSTTTTSLYGPIRCLSILSMLLLAHPAPTVFLHFTSPPLISLLSGLLP
jgi:serine/threonine protein kinase